MDSNTSMKQNSHNEENYYAVLGCDSSATTEVLKHCYQELIMRYHPDKQSGSEVSSDKFISINKAYNTLKDDRLRKEYDALLLSNNLNDSALIFAEFSKKDLTFVNGEVVFTCRCGDDISIPENVEENVLIECSECSNCILIK